MKRKYKNPHTDDSKRTFWEVIRWKTGRYKETVESPPLDFTYPAILPPFDPTRPSLVWMGHCTFLLEVDNLTILTDPIWSDYCSPVRIRGLKRHHDAPVLLADLPDIDIVLLSHNHYDHLDAPTVSALHRLHPQILWIVPERLSPWFKRRGIANVIEIPWWGTQENPLYKITAVPAQHFSGRTPWDLNKTHWNGYVFESKKSGKRFYFTGDTGYNPIGFKEIGQNWPYMDLSLIPIGTYVPRDFMSPVHCSPYDGVEIHQDVKSRLSVGMHWKTFCLSDEPLDRPPYDLLLALEKKNLNPETFLPLDPGTYINW
ncbi:MAG: MBL fold metallo-hydrolase [Verrucomicrobia bacterium]|nr:MBL fold metallo-hydrolase [Verrucomicrobiota bacterium]